MTVPTPSPTPAEAFQTLLQDLESGPQALAALAKAHPTWSRSTIINALRRLHSARQIHIHAWVNESPGKEKWSRVWALGAAADAPEPTGQAVGLPPQPPVPTFRPKISAQDNPWAGLIR